jgi:hypothetical protein
MHSMWWQVPQCGGVTGQLWKSIEALEDDTDYCRTPRLTGNIMIFMSG